MKRLALAMVVVLPGISGCGQSKEEPAVDAFQQGHSCLKEGEYDKAIANFTEAIRLNPDYVEAYSFRGAAYFEKLEHDKAIADWTEAIRIDPEDADIAFYSRGIAYHQKHEYRKAIDDFTEAIRLNPEDADFYKERSRSYLERREDSKAMADAIKARELRK